MTNIFVSWPIYAWAPTKFDLLVLYFVRDGRTTNYTTYQCSMFIN